MRAFNQRRRGVQSLGAPVVAGAAVVVVAMVLGVLWKLGVFDLARSRTAEASTAGLVAVPTPARTIPAYTKVTRDHFWDATQKRLTFKAQGAVSIAMQGREFSRSFEQEDNRLTMTSIDELHAQGGMRWTWQRVPTSDHLSPF